VCGAERDGDPLLPLHAKDVHRPLPSGENFYSNFIKKFQQFWQKNEQFRQYI
jgi:hypothetical protein